MTTKESYRREAAGLRSGSREAEGRELQGREAEGRGSQGREAGSRGSQGRETHWQKCIGDGTADACPDRDLKEDKPRESLEDCISKAFSLPEKDWSQYSPLTLAYIGDCVYDLVVRTVLVKRSNKPTDRLHRETAGVVRASAQSEAARQLMEEFTPEELAIYRRGKNARPHTMAKHATRREYLQATGLEAVLGFLYLDGRYERVVQLVRLAAGGALG